MFRIRIISEGEDLATFASRMTKENFWQLPSDLNDLGREIHSFMQQTIVNNIKRPGSTGNLVRAMQFEFFSRGFSCGFWIGDIDYLNQSAKYWRWLNYGVAGTGRKIPPGTNENANIKGQFIPGEPRPSAGAFRQGRFEKGFYPIYPKKPIEAINYIEKTIFQLENRLPIVVEARSGKVGGRTWVGAWGKYIRFHKVGEDIS